MFLINVAVQTLLANNHDREVRQVIIIFQDRRQAGHAVAHILRDELHEALDPHNAIVLGLPRGGVRVALEVARELRLPLDIFIVRKLGVPGQEELAMGAVPAVASVSSKAKSSAPTMFAKRRSTPSSRVSVLRSSAVKLHTAAVAPPP